MTITAIPTRFGIYDSADQSSILATIEMQDEYCSSIEINVQVTPSYWLELSAVIHKALVQMHGSD